eukprot:4793279-Prymnesium_polylepis.1
MAEEKVAAAAAGESIVDWESDEGAGDGEDMDEDDLQEEGEAEVAEADAICEPDASMVTPVPAGGTRKRHKPPSKDDLCR